MDPQQRLLLHAAFEALEDAGYSPDSTPSYQKDTFGVYVGAATCDYVDNLRECPDVYYSPGTLRAFLSGRISYAFGFKGPSIMIDTACSSSLVAIHQACRALQAGDCTAALAGGVNVISSPDVSTTDFLQCPMVLREQSSNRRLISNSKNPDVSWACSSPLPE